MSLKESMPESVPCILCGSEKNRPLFSKPSADGEPFALVQCSGCGLRFISPRPDESEIGRYYGASYFTNRTERGYDNYFSSGLRKEIERVMALNLADLGFYSFEKSLPGEKRGLDIGCAAGYFVHYLASRGWSAKGIDVSEDCVRHAAENLRLDAVRGNYLEARFEKRFHLITLWATIEHLHHPERFLEKAHAELEEGGRLYISTCRAGGINFMRLYGPRWRYYNFPEHLYFFSYGQLASLLDKNGFGVERSATYGSGFGKPGTVVRKAADFMAKRFRMGDMMLVAARKRP